jgi:hypothetical protein
MLLWESTMLQRAYLPIAVSLIMCDLAVKLSNTRLGKPGWGVGSLRQYS